MKRIMEKVEKKVKDAKGKPQDVDWKGLAEELKKEMPESSQKTVEVHPCPCFPHFSWASSKLVTPMLIVLDVDRQDPGQGRRRCDD